MNTARGHGEDVRKTPCLGVRKRRLEENLDDRPSADGWVAGFRWILPKIVDGPER
jgi:hypothetical protein